MLYLTDSLLLLGIGSHMATPLIDMLSGKYLTKSQYRLDLMHVYLTSIITRTQYKKIDACQKHVLSFIACIIYDVSEFSSSDQCQ